MGKKGGQAATEYLVLMGIILIVTIPVFYYVSGQVSSNTRMNQASDAVSAIVGAADSVYALGPGSRNYVWVSIPSGVKDVSVIGANNNLLRLQLSIFGGTSDIVGQSKVELEPQENILTNLAKQGTYRVFLEAEEDAVEFGLASDV